MLVSLSSIKIDEMGTGEFYVEKVIPLPYWIGVSLIVCISFFSIKYLENNRSMYMYIFIVIILLVSFRMAFSVMFTSLIDFEPDSGHYIKILDSWIRNGVDFASSGHYEHDYPLAFIIAFVAIKLGVPMDLFLRISPFIIYTLACVLLFLIISEVFPIQKKIAAVSIFLFSFSSLGYWISVHYCPDLLGMLFFFLSLYLSIKFAKNGVWSFKYLAPVLFMIILLILSHHLSTLYFILTTLGLALSTWFFKPHQFKGKALSFFILGIFTYSIWFAYGTLLYPDFFNVYIYFSGFGSPTEQVQQASFLTNITFIIYPLFIIALFIIEAIKIYQIKSLRDIVDVRKKLGQIRLRESSNTLLVFGIGFILILGLFIIGFAAPVSFPTRVLEVLCIGLYPLSSHGFLRIYENSSPKRRFLLLLLLIIVLFVAITGIHRYYSQIQRRVIIT